jgi:predicted nucleotidyltransferase
MHACVQLALRRIPEPQHAKALPLLMELTMASPADPVAIAVHVGQALEQAGIRYYVSGSFVSSIFGDFRFTRDIDIVIQAPSRSQLKAVVANIQQDFTFLEADIYEAHARRADAEAAYVSFALYHLHSAERCSVTTTI